MSAQKLFSVLSYSHFRSSSAAADGVKGTELARIRLLLLIRLYRDCLARERILVRSVLFPHVIRSFSLAGFLCWHPCRPSFEGLSQIVDATPLGVDEGSDSDAASDPAEHDDLCGLGVGDQDDDALGALGLNGDEDSSDVELCRLASGDEVTSKKRRRELVDVLEARAGDHQFLALAASHDAQQLHLGDKVALIPFGGQANSWDPRAVVVAAARQVGSLQGHHSRETTHVLDLLGAVACAGQSANCQQVRTLYATIGRRSTFLSVMRSWDSTPRKLEFGNLSDVLMPMSKFWHKEAGGKWELLSNDQMLEKQPACLRKRGVLEVLAQDVKLVWNESLDFETSSSGRGDVVVRRVERMLSQPNIIEDTKAGTYLAALEDGYEGVFSLESLAELQDRVSFVDVVTSSDVAGSNARMIYELFNMIAVFNDKFRAAGKSFRILAMVIFCSGHIATRLVSNTFKYVVLILAGRIRSVFGFYTLLDFRENICFGNPKTDLLANINKNSTLQLIHP